ncbi:MAG: 5'-3' exonuclease [Candidatus Limnocylindria bacterium]
MHVHLVDATFELFRAYFSRPAERGPDGRPVNAVRGLVDSLLSLLREPDVSHVGAATDHVIESWRNDVYPGYKSSAGMPRDLLAQFNDAERAIRALGLTCWPMVEDEADDALATVAARVDVDSRVEQIVICSVDKDLAQCVRGERTVLRDRMRKVTYDEIGVIAKFGVRPTSIPDYLALVGDSADGYPGLPGWGARSAGAVLARWEHLEAIPDDPLSWDVDIRGAGRLGATLRQHRDEALLYRRLATLGLDAAAPGTVDELAWAGVPRNEFEAFCAELGFESIQGRVHRWA